MSIRFHKGPSIITLFHDSTSSTSKQVLQLLSSYNSNPHQPTPAATSSSSAPGSHGESCIVEAHGSGADVNAYLRQAASDPPRSPLIQLEVVDRKSNPPTPDQMRSIVDYLVADTSDTQQKEKKYTTTGFDLNEHERRKLALKKHLKDDPTGASGMPKIKDGPLVVNWDEGIAATDLQGVKDMLKRLQEDARAEGKKDPEKGCVIC
ncbi:hypothetical protein PHSY_003464 [Pseudozyma hubeiensis SY62]|uniref:Uncharacterized protein n=1 Tax=Pseudozyma hubeiensis (strain SY62) TaxID=1305764 RepID=R9P3G7_PSEHS|nr:hypothetical protein PHSY_003464 [Pseudozyma hubeiensis SY62]GAC95886.1 hypothetical protein PHSY_003464 [Pseudozyma hubeiensis SY62]